MRQTLVAAATCWAAAALRAPLFDTQGRCGSASQRVWSRRWRSVDVTFSTRRLQRTANPPAPLPDANHRYVVVHKGDVLVETTNDVVDARFLDQKEAAPLVDNGSIVAWLGTLQSKGYWMLDVSHKAQPPSVKGAAFAPLRSPKGDKPAVLNRPADQLPYEDACALLVTASGLGRWHRSHMYCAACGAQTVSARHGRQRKCEKCSTKSRPRVDPSSIVLVASPDNSKVLLGRKAAWPEGKWSTLAGFVEFGESLEECVCREVLEESGVEVDRSTLRHVASQPWPFPSSLMVGYACRAKTEAITVDDELEDVAWFDRAFVAKALRDQGAGDAPKTPGGFHVPTNASLARVLIEGWVQESATVIEEPQQPVTSLEEARDAALGSGSAQAWELVEELERAEKRKASTSSLEDECAVDDADERCQKMAKDLAELDELMARGPGEARIREAARSMLRELEARYDNKMFDK